MPCPNSNRTEELKICISVAMSFQNCEGLCISQGLMCSFPIIVVSFHHALSSMIQDHIHLVSNDLLSSSIVLIPSPPNLLGRVTKRQFAKHIIRSWSCVSLFPCHRNPLRILSIATITNLGKRNVVMKYMGMAVRTELISVSLTPLFNLMSLPTTELSTTLELPCNMRLYIQSNHVCVNPEACKHLSRKD